MSSHGEYLAPPSCEEMCPFIHACAVQTGNIEKGVIDMYSMFAASGMAGELRRRRRVAQDCDGPLPVAKSEAVYCTTRNEAYTQDGVIVSDKPNREARRELRRAKTPNDILGMAEE